MLRALLEALAPLQGLAAPSADTGALLLQARQLLADSGAYRDAVALLSSTDQVQVSWQ